MFKNLGLILTIIGLVLVLAYTLSKEPVTQYDQQDYKELQEYIFKQDLKIDSLENIKDSLLIKLDSSKVKIKVIYKNYEKEYNNIIVQSTDSDCMYFSKYLSLNFK